MNPQPFEEAWKATDGRFPVLQEFTGGMATVFPETASVLGWEKNEYCQSFTDFSLECILQSKQVERLSNITMH